MKRREALIKSTWVLKATVFAPGILSTIQGCSLYEMKEQDLEVLNQDKNDLVKAIADTIIPKTDTPSATDVKVNLFLDIILRDVFSKEDTEKFLSGLLEFDDSCKDATGDYFTGLSTEMRTNYLQAIDKKVMSSKYENRVPFYYSFKHLISLIYFSSEGGVKGNLNYDPVPGAYVGEIPYKSGDKIRVGNNM